jgi:hypothetical protein
MLSVIAGKAALISVFKARRFPFVKEYKSEFLAASTGPVCMIKLNDEVAAAGAAEGSKEINFSV